MQLTREQIKTMIHEEIEEALKIRKRPKKTKKVPNPKFKGIKFREDPETGKMVPVGKKIRKKEKPADFNLSGDTASPKDALKGDTAAPDDKPDLDAETEDDRLRRMQDLYKEGLQEQIFNALVAKIRGDK